MTDRTIMKSNIMMIFTVFISFLIFLQISVTSVAAEEKNNSTNGWNNFSTVLFKTEYEKENGQSNGTGNVYQNLIVPEDFPVVYADSELIMSILEEGTGVIYFGFAQCPWCRTLLPNVFEVVQESDEIRENVVFYYYDLRNDRDEYMLDEDGSPVMLYEGSEFYQNLLSRLDGWLGGYKGLNDFEKKRIYMPTLIFVKEGEIQAVHINTVDSQENGFDELDGDQKMELQEKLVGKLNLLIS